MLDKMLALDLYSAYRHEWCHFSHLTFRKKTHCSMIASFIFIMTLSSHPCCQNLPPETKYSKFDRHLSLSLETVTWSRSHLFASPAPSKSSQPSGCAGMCGIYYLLLALNDCWCECCDGPLLHLLWLSMLWTNQDSALCCAKVKKETLSFCLCTHNVALHCLFMRTHG